MEAGHSGRDLASRGDRAGGGEEKGREREARKRGSAAAAKAAGSMRRMDRSKKRLHLQLPMLGQAGGSGGQGNGERIEGGKPLQSPGLRGVQMVPCTGPPRTSKMHRR